MSKIIIREFQSLVHWNKQLEVGRRNPTGIHVRNGENKRYLPLISLRLM